MSMKSESQKTLSDGMGEFIASESMQDIVGDYVEMGLDAVLDEGLLREVPIVKTLIALNRVRLGVGDRLLLRRIFHFLASLDGLSADQRREMIEKLESDPSYERKVGEHLIDLLDRIDSHAKPEMIGKAFKAFADGKISVEMLQRLCHSIEALPVFLIRKLSQFSYDDNLNRNLGPTDCQALVNAGLGQVLSLASGLAYRPNEVCETFTRLKLHTVGVGKQSNSRS